MGVRGAFRAPPPRPLAPHPPIFGIAECNCLEPQSMCGRVSCTQRSGGPKLTVCLSIYQSARVYLCLYLCLRLSADPCWGGASEIPKGCLLVFSEALASKLATPPPPPPPTSPPTVPIVQTALTLATPYQCFAHSLTAFALTTLTSPAAQTAPPVFASPTLPPRPPFHPPSLFRSPQCVPKPLRHRLHPSSCFCFAHRSSSPPASPPHAPTPSVCFVPLRHQCHPSWLR